MQIYLNIFKKIDDANSSSSFIMQIMIIIIIIIIILYLCSCHVLWLSSSAAWALACWPMGTSWIIPVHARRNKWFPLGCTPSYVLWDIFISNHLIKCFLLSRRRSSCTFQTEPWLEQRLSNVCNASLEDVIELFSLFIGQHTSFKDEQMPFFILNSDIVTNCLQTMRWWRFRSRSRGSRSRNGYSSRIGSSSRTGPSHRRNRRPRSRCQKQRLKRCGWSRCRSSSESWEPRQRMWCKQWDSSMSSFIWWFNKFVKNDTTWSTTTWSLTK